MGERGRLLPLSIVIPRTPIQGATGAGRLGTRHSGGFCRQVWVLIFRSCTVMWGSRSFSSGSWWRCCAHPYKKDATYRAKVVMWDVRRENMKGTQENDGVIWGWVTSKRRLRVKVSDTPIGAPTLSRLARASVSSVQCSLVMLVPKCAWYIRAALI